MAHDVSGLELSQDSWIDFKVLERLAQPRFPKIRFSEKVLGQIAASHRQLQAILAEKQPVYGSTTGFGPLVGFASGGSDSLEHGDGLLEHLGVGTGAPAPDEVVRAAMAIRLLTVSRGHSGVRPEVVEAYAALFNCGGCPRVPSIGSLGASGDLIPLSYIAKALTGRGEFSNEKESTGAEAFFKQNGLRPVQLEPRDALALVNGTSFCTAYAALSLAKGCRLLCHAESITALCYATLGASRQALHPALHRARGQNGQMESAAAIRHQLKIWDAEWVDTNRPLQEIYSLRCAPQIIGACRSQLGFAQELIDAEINGVDDNPLIICGENEGGGETPGLALHGGNFHAQQIAFACDMINGALTQLAVLIERQLDLLLNPQQNGGAPKLLARDPGPQSGLGGAQLNASAIISEMRGRCQQHATSSVPTNGGNQDVVPMAATAARAAFEQTRHLADIEAITAIALLQLSDLRRNGYAPGRAGPTPDHWPDFDPLVRDRALRKDVETFSHFFLTEDNSLPETN